MDEFRNVDWDTLARSVAHPLMIDGRNLYSESEAVAHGFQYVCMGQRAWRGSVLRNSEPLRIGPLSAPDLNTGVAPLASPPSYSVPAQSRP